MSDAMPPVPDIPASDAAKAQPGPQGNAQAAPTEPPLPKPAREWPLGLSKRQGIAASSAVGLALVVGLVIGLLVVQPSLASVRDQASDAQRYGESMDRKLEDTRAELKDLQRKQAAAQKRVNDRDTELDNREAELVTREEAVTAREAAVEQAETVQAANQFSGGLHVIGTTVAAGVYQTNGVSGCYYAWKTGTGSDASIIDNNIVDGSATVTLNNGDVFESSRCGTWQKIG